MVEMRGLGGVVAIGGVGGRALGLNDAVEWLQVITRRYRFNSVWRLQVIAQKDQTPQT